MIATALAMPTPLPALGLQQIPAAVAPGAASASVRATDAVRGVHVGDLVIVETRGVADRVATAAVTPRPLTDRAAGDQVATIGAKTVAVGESVTLNRPGFVGGLC